jgi:hypothetical protein
MIAVAFVALILLVIIQSIYLQRAWIREQMVRVEAEMNRARAEAALLEYQAQVKAFQEILDRTQADAAASKSKP